MCYYLDDKIAEVGLNYRQQYLPKSKTLLDEPRLNVIVDGRWILIHNSVLS